MIQENVPMNHQSTILIVDDQLTAREVLKGLLMGRGHDLVLATDGPDALKKAIQFTPDLILLDVMMPGMDGFEVCEQLRANPLLAEVPVIMVTALDDYESRLRGLEAGADDFISKPFDDLELEARVETITKLNRYRRLHKERVKVNWMVEKSEDGYLMINQHDQILYANQQARRYLGLPMNENEPIQATFLQIARQQYHYDPEHAWLKWPTLLPPNQSSRHLVRPESSTARALWLQVDTLNLPAGPDGEWMVHLRDVTTQMTLRQRVWQFEQMVSHKLRTPLQGMVAGLELLEEEGVTQINEVISELFELVFESTQRINREVDSILEYVNAPNLIEASTAFDLSQVEPIIKQISHDLGLTNVVLSDKIELTHSKIPLPQPAIEVILHELFHNAQKFHPQHTPTIEVELSSLPNQSQIQLQISDNGLTLSPEELTQIWTPYYQVDKYLTGQVKGMGLGLSRVALLIKSVGGSYRVYNRLDETGIVIELTLPYLKE